MINFNFKRLNLLFINLLLYRIVIYKIEKLILHQRERYRDRFPSSFSSPSLTRDGTRDRYSTHFAIRERRPPFIIIVSSGDNFVPEWPRFFLSSFLRRWHRVGGILFFSKNISRIRRSIRYLEGNDIRII